MTKQVNIFIQYVALEDHVICQLPFSTVILSQHHEWVCLERLQRQIMPNGALMLEKK